MNAHIYLHTYVYNSYTIVYIHLIINNCTLSMYVHIIYVPLSR